MGRLLFFVPRVRLPLSLGPAAYLLDLMTGAGEEAGRLGHEFHLVTRESMARLKESWDLAVGILYPGDSWLPQWHQWTSRIPAVHLMTHPDPSKQPDVAIDEPGAMRLLLDHLCGQGIRKLAFLSITHRVYAQERAQAFSTQVRARGLPLKAEWIPGYDLHGRLLPGFRPMADAETAAYTSYGRRRLQVLWPGLMKDPPQAVLCETDRLGILFLRHAEDHGIHVPGELLVSGYDDGAFAGTRGRVQNLTSIRQGLGRLARMAVRRVDAMSRGLDPGPVLRLTPTLVIRGSTLRPEPSTDRGDDFLPRCQVLMKRHLDDPRATLLLAEAMGLTVPYFLSRYRSASGSGFKADLTHLRLARAREMLLETDQSITEIHHACGYQSHQVFNRAFRAATGRTAERFRWSNGRGIKGRTRRASRPFSG